MEASRNGHIAVAALLLERGAMVDALDLVRNDILQLTPITT